MRRSIVIYIVNVEFFLKTNVWFLWFSGCFAVPALKGAREFVVYQRMFFHVRAQWVICILMLDGSVF